MESLEFLIMMYEILLEAIYDVTPKDLLLLLINILILFTVFSLTRRKVKEDLEKGMGVIGKAILEYTNSIRLIAKLLIRGYITEGRMEELAEMSTREKRLPFIKATSLKQLLGVYNLKSITVANEEGLLVESTIMDKSESEKEAALVADLARIALNMFGKEHRLQIWMKDELIMMGILQNPRLYYLVRPGEKITQRDQRINVICDAIEDYLARKYS